MVAAARADGPESKEALADLCEAYWYPVYGRIRRAVRDPEKAKDLTQGFFAHLLDKRILEVADPCRGSFRSFLATAARNYLANERARSGALKRGGAAPHLNLDFPGAEARYSSENGDRETPDAVFEKRWARALLDRALGRFRAEIRSRPEGNRWRRLEPFLTDRPSGYAEMAAELGTSEDTVKTTVHRMRRKFGEFLRDEVARTVQGTEDVDGEIRFLFSVLDR